MFNISCFECFEDALSGLVHFHQNPFGEPGSHVESLLHAELCGGKMLDKVVYKFHQRFNDGDRIA